MRIWFIICILLTTTGVDLFSQPNLDNLRNQPYLKYKDQVNCDSAMTTLELRICANLKFQECDSVLQSLYNQILFDIDENYLEISREKFENVQQKWLEYRDEHCILVWEIYHGGSLQSVMYLYCLADITNERIRELRELTGEL